MSISIKLTKHFHWLGSAPLSVTNLSGQPPGRMETDRAEQDGFAFSFLAPDGFAHLISLESAPLVVWWNWIGRA